MTAWSLPLAAGGFWAGLILWPVVGRAFPAGTWIAAGVGCLLGAARAAGGRSRGWIVLAVELVAVGVVALGVGWGGVHEHRVQASLLAGLAPHRVEIDGSLRADPSRTSRGWWAMMDASQVRWWAGAASVREPVWVSGDGDAPVAVRGDRIRVSGSLSVPDDQDFGASLLRRGIAAEMTAREVVRVGPSANPLVRAAQAFRGFIGRSIARLFPPREAGLLLGLALGDASRLDPVVIRHFEATGLQHLLVVSGDKVAK